MRAFSRHIGRAAPLLLHNIDTDAIIPSREMKRVSKQGLGESLFANWRYLDSTTREPDPSFILNRPGFEETSILLSLTNFGCGSSREFAVWALSDYGIRAILAPGFGAIFQKNCVSNGILTCCVDEPTVMAIAAWVEKDPASHHIEVNLETRSITWADHTAPFQIHDSDRSILLAGLDPITQTQLKTDEIAEFERHHFAENPWVVGRGI